MKLGRLYEHGWGAPHDLVEAYAWYWAASERGNAKAKEALSRLEPQLSAAQMADARDRASHFVVEKQP
jgi:TPR repeat protein